jgi:ribonuclease HII
MWSHDFFEKILHANGCSVIAGVDEVGRGALAGPVVAAAIVLSGDGDYEEIKDSKALTAASRERLAARLGKEALTFGFGLVDETEIDRINILQATYKAMRQAIANLSIVPDAILVDGFCLPGLDVHCIGIIQGDSLSYSISAASIVAKVYRDSLMISLAEDFPEYGFDQHKGYGTPYHRQAIAQYGPCRHHRMTFRGSQGFRTAGGNNDQ